jgi:hypothetical protein
MLPKKAINKQKWSKYRGVAEKEIIYFPSGWAKTSTGTSSHRIAILQMHVIG